jgi:ribonucleoside-diphosphate reductase alpha chain
MNELLEYYAQDDFAAHVWKSKYAKQGEKTPDDMHWRMATEFSKIRAEKDGSKTKEEWKQHFYGLFKDFANVLPQGRVMAGLGTTENYRSLSNCLRLPPPKDSYSSIMYVDTMLVSAAKRGCGYGVGLSNLRPELAVTTNAANSSSGVIAFGNRYSNSTHEVGQQGRRGACLLDLDIRHPSAPMWSIAKKDERIMTGANISFKVWGEFIKMVQQEEDYILRWPVDMKVDISADLLTYGELTPYNKGYVKRIKAVELWNSAIHGVWSDGCPGLQFWEKITDYDPASVYSRYVIDGTNACGEQPMAAFDTCRLIAENLFGVVKDPFRKGSVDFEKLYQNSYEQLLLGDDLVDLECIYIQRIIDKITSDPEPEEEKAVELSLWNKVLDMARSGRRVGCGITGLADMLAAVGLKYDSEEALELTEKVMFIKMQAELDATIDLAERYGPFEGWDPALEYVLDKEGNPVAGKNEFYEFLLDTYPEQVERMCKVGRRNVNWSTIAPVGTLSIITKAIKYPNISSGCEPQFALYFFRNKKVSDGELFDFKDEVGIKWKTYPIMMGAFKDWIEAQDGFDIEGEYITSSEAMTNIEHNKKMLEAIYELSPWYKATSGEIDWKKRIDMQAILQKYTTSAISSTINLPSTVKEETISELYLYAFEKGLKGITCYRDGSKGGVLVTEKKTNSSFEYKDAPKRPKELPAELNITRVQGMKYGVVVGLMEGKPYELFAFPLPEGLKKECAGHIVKQRGSVYNFKCDDGTAYHMENAGSHEQQMLTRLVSGMLRHGAKPQFVMEQIEKCELEIVSFGKAIGRVLKRYVSDQDMVNRNKCKECSSTNLRVQEGCLTCNDCGSSKCG